MSRSALRANGLDAVAAGAEDAETAVAEGADPVALCAPGQLGPDEPLISAMGRPWVLDAAGAPDHSDESWESHGLPWCARYSEAYRQRCEELALVEAT